MSSASRSIRASASRASRGRVLLVRALVLIGVVAMAGPAWAIPSFARKYKTSCTTCHTVFPRLTPFGEAFRRNGFRWPGIDSDAIKGDQVAMGQEAYKKVFPDSVWPGSLSGFPGLSLGLHGDIVAHPDKNSSGGQADNGAMFSLDNLLEEGNLFAGGSFDDKITYFSEIVFSDEGVEVEHGMVHFGDLIGPAHAVNLTAGKWVPTLTPFGAHSTYLADMAIPMVDVTMMYGGADEGYVTTGNSNELELEGTAGGAFEYAVGVSAGPNADVYNSGNLHAYVGYKIGGMSLNGEGDDASAAKGEESVAISAFFALGRQHFETGSGAIQRNDPMTVGGSIRAEYDKLELDTGAYFRKDNHGQDGGAAVSSLVQWNELAYRVYPWLVPAARVEFIHESPDGGSTASLLRIIPGAAMLIRPNLKFVVTIPIEQASGAPDAGWEMAGGVAEPDPMTNKIGPEIESVVGTLFYAF